MTDIVPSELFGCFEAPEQLTRLALARRHVVDTCPGPPATERVALDDSYDRVLASTVKSQLRIPPADNSAMDGFAIAGDSAGPSLQVIGEAFAGHPFSGVVGDGEAVRIMTGAFMPAGTTLVVAQENAICDGDRVTVGAAHKTGQNVRAAGEDIEIGDTIVAAGKRIGSAETGILASVGTAHVEVYKRLRVGVFSTGDELVEPGQSPQFGQINDCNRALLKSLLNASGCDVIDLGILKDDADAVTEALAAAADGVDAIITSGGISTGAADHVGNSVRTLGELGVWRIALRPGRPFAYGRIGNTRFFGLPGNPVAVMVTYYTMVVPALRRMSGDRSEWQPYHFMVRCPEPINKKPNRTELYRAVLSYDDEGNLLVKSTGSQGSGLLTSMSQANCFIVLDHDDETTEAGALVPVLPFSALI